MLSLVRVMIANRINFMKNTFSKVLWVVLTGAAVYGVFVLTGAKALACTGDCG